jgi:predicted ATPase
VLDGCEHVLEESARIMSTLLAECPHLRMLATSREALHVVGEVRVPVAPLGSDAVDLFLERARAARPGFEADEDALEQAAEIVRRVDGLPLAIELAAARVNVLGLGELVSILEHRAALLRDRPASDPSRTALQALVEWSYDLLHGDEKTLLQQLAVHRGGASLASVSAVAAAHDLNESTVSYLVGTLVDKSIVSASFADGAARYDMLDTVRDYVLERLDESDGLADARAAHAEYFAALAEEARLELRGREWRKWENRLELENDNFWAALAHASEVGAPGVAIRLGSLAWYFALAERVSEGRRFLDLVLNAEGDEGPQELQAELLAGICFLAAEELDIDAAVAAGERALAVATTAGAPRQLGLARLVLALALAQGGDERAVAMAQDAAVTFEAVGDDWGIAASKLIQATAGAHAGDVAAVAEMAAAVARHSDAIDYDAFRVPGLLLEGWVAERRQEGDAVVDAYRRALDLARRIGFGDHAAFALVRLGAYALANGDLRAAEELEQEALLEAQASNATWVKAYANLVLARIAAAAGDGGRAGMLYREVIEWSQAPRPHQARESLFLALAGNPGAAALAGLEEVAALA